MTLCGRSRTGSVGCWNAYLGLTSIQNRMRLSRPEKPRLPSQGDKSIWTSSWMTLTTSSPGWKARRRGANAPVVWPWGHGGTIYHGSRAVFYLILTYILGIKWYKYCKLNKNT